MEFQAWFDLQLSGIVAVFGESMESLGLHSQKSQPLIGADTSHKVESTKSLILGDILGFLQKHFNQILEMKDPDYELEIVGYEKDDPKLILDIDKIEVDTYKSIDEKRAEKGLEPFNQKWSQVPLSPQVTQMVMAEQAGGSPFGDMGDTDEEDFDESDEEEEETGEDEGEEPDSGGNVPGWDEMEQQQNGEAAEKSLYKKSVVRIVI